MADTPFLDFASLLDANKNSVSDSKKGMTPGTYFKEWTNAIREVDELANLVNQRLSRSERLLAEEALKRAEERKRAIEEEEKLYKKSQAEKRKAQREEENARKKAQEDFDVAYEKSSMQQRKLMTENYVKMKEAERERIRLTDTTGKKVEAWDKKNGESLKKYQKEKMLFDSYELSQMSKKEKKEADIANKRKKLDDAKQKAMEVYFKKQKELLEANTEEEKKAVEEKYKKEESVAEKEVKKATGNLGSAEVTARTEKLKAVASAIGGPIQQAIDTVAGMQAPLMTRLLGTNADFGRITGRISENLMTSPVVKVQNVYENLSKMVEAGIADNLEQRAFLATVSDKIATTFDAFDSNLLRLIRLQQADITATRLGMEARLTEVLNANYLDTSYLNNMFDTVAGNILEASSQMGKETAMGFEYNVQKWLGSLYSLGLSQQAVSQISSGINLLGTGGAEALSGSPMQSLFAIGAMRGGADFGEMLSQGLDDSNINKLMKGVVEYLREIAQNSNNRVAKNVLGGIFGMSVADLTAFSNLSNEQINRMFGETQSGANLNWQAQSKLSSVLGRMSSGEMIQNIMSNVAFGAGQKVADNPFLLGTLTAANMLEGVTGGIKLPHVGVLGNFLDTSALTVEGLLKTGVMGIGMIGSLIGALGAPLGGNLDLSSSKWASTITGSGTWFGGLKQGLDIGTSGAMKVGSGGDITGQSITEAQASAESTAKITGYDEKKEEKSANDIWNSLFEDRKPIVIELTEADLEKIEKRILAGVKKADSESPIVAVFNGTGDDGKGDSLMKQALRKIAENSSQPLNVELSGIDAGAFNGINLFNL